MTFEDARQEVKDMSGNRYRSLYYEVTENETGVVSIQCRVYVDSGMSSVGATWRAALDGMKKLLSPAPDPTPVEDEAPIDDNLEITNTTDTKEVF